MNACAIIPFNQDAPKVENPWAIRWKAPPSKKRRIRPPKVVKEPKHNPKALSHLYRKFITPYVPEKITPAFYGFYMNSSCMALLNCVCHETAIILCLMLAKKINSPHEWSPKRIIAKIEGLRISLIQAWPKPAKTAFMRLKLRHHQSAYIICRSLAFSNPDSKQVFFIAARDLQNRLLLNFPMAATRCLNKLCKIGVMRKIASGETKWQAKASDKKADATSFIWMESRVVS